MSEENKAKVQEGMAQGRAIRQYLELVNTETFRKRGPRARSAEAIQLQISLALDPVERLKLRSQYREALEIEMTEADLVKAFLEHVVPFSERYGVTYGDWREEGVPASILKEAGITRAG